MKPINFTKPLTIPEMLLMPYRIDPWHQFLRTFVSLAKALLGPIAVTATAMFIDNAVLYTNGEVELTSLFIPILLLTLNFFAEPLGEFLIGVLAPYHAEIEWEKTEYPLSRRAASLLMKDLENEDLCAEIGFYIEGYTAFELGDFIRNFIFRVLSLVSYFVIIGSYLPWVALAAFIISIPMCIFSFSNEKDSFQNNINNKRMSAYNETYSGYLIGRKVVDERTTFGFTPFVTDKYITTLEKVYRDRIHVRLNREKRKYIVSVFQYALCFISVLMLISPLTNAEISLGVFASVVQAVFAAIPMLISGFMSDTFFILSLRRNFRQFNKFISLSTDIGISAAPSEKAPVFSSLELKNVSFTYPGTEKKVLSGVNLTIRAGQKTALVGENGSGKTTLCKLILGYYDDYEGEILLNGVELRKWDKADIKAMISALTQNFSRYAVSVEDNIRLGADISDEEVDRAISLAGLSKTLERMPDGKKTMLGKLYDGGVDISGGEWQRVAMARVIARPAGLKFLDEPTAALDPMAERDFYDQFDAITKESATILVSHRLGAVRTADTIYVLDNGTVVETGSHDELMKKNGLYADMYEKQRGWYL